ncbi:hypothetical protein RU639_013587 [Aspergillus parasiticus]|uniref:Uncharacterized protein n=1 Tax=Aspergillus transmontanensis TaxID=1034304 RepID=A0A5N6VRN4_9EURO|nr:hypothetical protein BDV41DRAFT_356505 [Aspergillus transmontanensis]
MNIKWNDYEIRALRPFIKRHEELGTPWWKRAACWKKEVGTTRSTGAIRGQMNRLALMGRRIPDDSESPPPPLSPREAPSPQGASPPQEPPTKATMKTLSVLTRPHKLASRPYQAKPSKAKRRSMWSVPSSPEGSPTRGSGDARALSIQPPKTPITAKAEQKSSVSNFTKEGTLRSKVVSYVTNTIQRQKVAAMKALTNLPQPGKALLSFLGRLRRRKRAKLRK